MAMASQIVGEGSCYEWSSYVRGYHVYQTMWTPAVGETLRLAVEPTNSHDIYAVALMMDETELYVLSAMFLGMSAA